jgi:hypothetical protein
MRSPAKENETSSVSSGKESRGAVPLCHTSLPCPVVASATQIAHGKGGTGISGLFCSVPAVFT